jgi:hypothetical protein
MTQIAVVTGNPKPQSRTHSVARAVADAIAAGFGAEPAGPPGVPGSGRAALAGAVGTAGTSGWIRCGWGRAAASACHRVRTVVNNYDQFNG